MKRISILLALALQASTLFTAQQTNNIPRENVQESNNTELPSKNTSKKRNRKMYKKRMQYKNKNTKPTRVEKALMGVGAGIGLLVVGFFSFVGFMIAHVIRFRCYSNRT